MAYVHDPSLLHLILTATTQSTFLRVSGPRVPREQLYEDLKLDLPNSSVTLLLPRNRGFISVYAEMFTYQIFAFPEATETALWSPDLTFNMHLKKHNSPL